MLPIGLSSCGKPLTDELFAAYRAAGITHMEIAISPEEYLTLNYREVRERADRHGILLWSLHLPFAPFSTMDISRPDLTKASVAHLTEIIKRGADIGVKSADVFADDTDPDHVDTGKDKHDGKESEHAAVCPGVAIRPAETADDDVKRKDESAESRQQTEIGQKPQGNSCHTGQEIKLQIDECPQRIF